MSTTTIHESVVGTVPIMVKEYSLHGRYWQCGYAQLPEGHPWRDLDLQFEDNHVVDIRGGITYGPTTDGWIGFDTNHPEDHWPESDRETPLPYTDTGTRMFFSEFFEASISRGDHNEPVTWSHEKVLAETKRLAHLVESADPS